MSVTIQIKRGTNAQVQAATLAIGELAFATDTKSVFTYDGVVKQLVGRAMYDALANRPTYGVAGRMFMDSGTGILYMDTGSSWVSLGSGSHTNLSNIGNNTHAQIDTFITSKASASGLASLNGSSLVVQNPANATATPTASKIPIADGNGKLDGWVSLSSKANVSHTHSASDISSGIGLKAASFTQATSSPVTLLDPPNGTIITKIVIVIDTAASAGSPTLAVGITGDTDRDMDELDSDVKTAGTYIVEPYTACGTNGANILLTIVPSSQTFSGRCYLHYAVPV